MAPDDAIRVRSLCLDIPRLRAYCLSSAWRHVKSNVRTSMPLLHRHFSTRKIDNNGYCTDTSTVLRFSAPRRLSHRSFGLSKPLRQRWLPVVSATERPTNMGKCKGSVSFVATRQCLAWNHKHHSDAASWSNSIVAIVLITCPGYEIVSMLYLLWSSRHLNLRAVESAGR